MILNQTKNFLANSTNKWSDSEIEGLYRLLCDWQPNPFPSQGSLFRKSCVPGIENHGSVILEEIKAQLESEEGKNPQEREYKYTQRVLQAFEEAMVKIINP